MNEAQRILEGLPILSDLIPIIGARKFLTLPYNQVSGFFHTNGEFQYLVKHENRLYRLPRSNMERRAIAEVNLVTI